MGEQRRAREIEREAAARCVRRWPGNSDPIQSIFRAAIYRWGFLGGLEAAASAMDWIARLQEEEEEEGRNRGEPAGAGRWVLFRPSLFVV